MTKQERLQQALRLRKRYETQFRQPLKAALKHHYSSFTTLLKTHGAQYTLAHLHSNLIDGHLASVVQRLYVTAGIGRAQLTYRELKRLPRQQKVGNMGFNAQWTSDILSYFKLFLFDKTVLPISETTQEYIRQVLNRGINDGASIEEMVQEINREDFLNGRVETILRTELTRAISYGNNVAANTYEYKTMKGWTAVHDNRTRHAHISADGQQVAIDEKFTVGGELMDFPGDPDASAANTINCRCASYIVPVRDGRGRLVPKNTEQPLRIEKPLRSRVQQAIDELLS